MSLLAGIKDHVNNVGHCDRCKTVVEPRLSLQWFVKIQPLRTRRLPRSKKGHIRFTPEMYGKTYLNWMENIHDWCISRQLWWGHRIPAWQCSACHKPTVTREDPKACANCGSDKLHSRRTCWTRGFRRGCCRFRFLAGRILREESRRFRRVLPNKPAHYGIRHPVFLGGPDDHAGLLVC